MSAPAFNPFERVPGAPVNAGAIHRCVLAGFLGQIGAKGENREYSGPRGLRFVLSPGSVLFRHDPPWVVAAELVETTRLYARTVGRIRSDWVERVAPGQVQREHFEPHWLASAGQVAAWERVSLHGLVLVAKRRVPFGPIDPKASRDIFIQEALVDEQVRTEGEFLRHNRELIEELEKLEAKKRERTMLVDLRARFDFYDRHVPADVHSTPSFEKWRRRAERGNPRLLFMTRADLLRPGAAGLAAADFPDVLELDSLRLPLDYRHEPGDPDDGITVTVPIGALGRLTVGRLEWLVPGMLREKVVALLRTLPKRIRVRFVPAAEYADGAAESLAFGHGSLPQRLAEYLHRLTGTPLSDRDFDLAQLPAHLRMNVRVLDAEGAVAATGRDLTAIQRTLASRASASIPSDGAAAAAAFATSDAEGSSSRGAARGTGSAAGGRDTSTGSTATAGDLPVAPRERMIRFEIPSLPERVEVRQGGMSLPAHPALADVGDAVSLRLLPSPDAARRTHRAGIRRLLALALGDEIRPMLDFLPSPTGVPGIDGLALLHAPYGPREVLERELVDRIAERAGSTSSIGAPRGSGDTSGAGPGGPAVVASGAVAGGAGTDLATVRDAAMLEAIASAARPELWEAGREVVDLAWRVLGACHEILRTIDAPAPSTWQDAFDDVGEQLAALCPPRFLVETDWEALVHYPRYLAAVVVRLQKLRESGHLRDLRLMAEVRPHWKRCLEHRAELAASGRTSPELERFRWMIEEFRVSLFAQELRTAAPVSAQRLARLWQQLP
ncbi:MAG: DUF3418 domain-containing protein [Phycisphaerales bacterium]